MALGSTYEECHGSNLTISHLFSVICLIVYLVKKLVEHFCWSFWHLTGASSVIAQAWPTNSFRRFRRDTDLNFKLVSVSVTNECQKIVGQW